jgi:hypothetical protein
MYKEMKAKSYDSNFVRNNYGDLSAFLKDHAFIRGICY